MLSQRPAPMWAVDASSFRFIVANDDAARLFGFAREALLLLTMYDVLHPDEWQRFGAAFSQANLKGDAGDWMCRWPNGSCFHMGFRHYGTVINGNAVVLAWAVKIKGHAVLAAPLLADRRDTQMSDDLHAQSSFCD